MSSKYTYMCFLLIYSYSYMNVKHYKKYFRSMISCFMRSRFSRTGHNTGLYVTENRIKNLFFLNISIE